MSITPEQVKKLRQRAGLTQKEAAEIVRVVLRSWQSWEAPTDTSKSRKISENIVELFCLKTGISYPPRL